MKMDEKGKLITPSADQLQQAFIRKEQKNLKKRIKDGHQVENHLGLKIKELGEIIKNESKVFIDEIGEEFKEVKKVCDEKIAKLENKEPRIEEIEMQMLTIDANDVESEDTIYFDKSDKLIFKPSVNEDMEQLDVSV